MRNIYVYTKSDGLGKLIFYTPGLCPLYFVECYMSKINGYSGKFHGQEIHNVWPFVKPEIKFLHKKPLRHMIERRRHGLKK